MIKFFYGHSCWLLLSLWKQYEVERLLTGYRRNVTLLFDIFLLLLRKTSNWDRWIDHQLLWIDLLMLRSWPIIMITVFHLITNELREEEKGKSQRRRIYEQAAWLIEIVVLMLELFIFPKLTWPICNKIRMILPNDWMESIRFIFMHNFEFQKIGALVSKLFTRNYYIHIYGSKKDKALKALRWFHA